MEVQGQQSVTRIITHTGSRLTLGSLFDFSTINSGLFLFSGNVLYSAWLALSSTAFFGSLFLTVKLLLSAGDLCTFKTMDSLDSPAKCAELQHEAGEPQEG